MSESIKLDFFDEAALSLNQIGKFTGRKPIEVVADALRIYELILYEETIGSKIFFRKKNPGTEDDLGKLVKNIKLARNYFKTRNNYQQAAEG